MDKKARKVPYIETIREKAVLESMDLSRAAYDLTLELRNYRQLGGMERAIEAAKQQLAVIDMYTLDRQQALTILNDFYRIGISEKEIISLLGIVRRWNDQHPGLRQGNGGQSSSSSSYNYDYNHCP